MRTEDQGEIEGKMHRDEAKDKMTKEEKEEEDDAGEKDENEEELSLTSSWTW